MENLITPAPPKSDGKLGEVHGQTSFRGSLLRLLRLKEFLFPPLHALSHLNPWSSFQSSKKIEKGNVIVEEDGHGIRRTYDSSLLKALIQTIWRRLLWALIFEASSSILFTTSSLVTKRLIAYIATSNAWSKASELERSSLVKPQSIGTGIALAIGLALMREAGSVVHSHYQGTAYTCGEWYLNLLFEGFGPHPCLLRHHYEICRYRSDRA